MSAGLFYVKMWHFFLVWLVGMRSFCFSLLFFSAMLAAETPRVDVEQTMKNMGFYYKQAIDAQAAEELQPALQQLIELAKQAQTAAYPADKAEQLLAVDPDLVLLQYKSSIPLYNRLCRNRKHLLSGCLNNLPIHQNTHLPHHT